MRHRTMILLITVGIFAFLFYHFFVDTLSLSEIIGNTSDPKANILINIFDFDTGLTRYDMYHLSQRSDYWQRRIRQVNSIRDPKKREIENEKLTAEMMRDPSMKKIVRKCLGVGGKTALGILQAAVAFRNLGL